MAIHEALILNYKAVQQVEGVVDIYIEGVENNRYEATVFEELTKYFNSDIQFNLLFVNEFARTRKESQYFESKIVK